MLKIQFIKNRQQSRDSVNDIIRRIQSGDKLLKEKFINEYRAFIIKSVSKTIGKFVEVENSEEYSIGLSAFNESIDCYNENLNANFFKFSDQVIKRKLYTFFNKQKKELKTLPFSHLEDSVPSFESKYLSISQNSLMHQIEMKDQYELFESRLAEFGISLEDLVESRPKHRDSMQQAIRIGKLLAEDDLLYKMLVTKKAVPMSELQKRIKVNHKAIEKNRKFIISVCLILNGGFDDIKEHIMEYVNLAARSKA